MTTREMIEKLEGEKVFDYTPYSEPLLFEIESIEETRKLGTLLMYARYIDTGTMRENGRTAVYLIEAMKLPRLCNGQGIHTYGRLFALADMDNKED